MSLSFYLFFLYLSLFLCSYLIYQRLRPSVVLLQLLSSSFHNKLLIPFLTIKSPPSTSIFFFLFLSWSNNLFTTRTPRIKTHQHHKHQNPFLSTHKPRSPLPTPIHKHLDPFLISYCSEYYFSFSLSIQYFQFDFFSLRFNSSTLVVNHHFFVKFPNQTYALKTFKFSALNSSVNLHSNCKLSFISYHSY